MKKLKPSRNLHEKNVKYRQEKNEGIETFTKSSQKKGKYRQGKMKELKPLENLHGKTENIGNISSFYDN